MAMFLVGVVFIVFLVCVFASNCKKLYNIWKKQKQPPDPNEYHEPCEKCGDPGKHRHYPPPIPASGYLCNDCYYSLARDPEELHQHIEKYNKINEHQQGLCSCFHDHEDEVSEKTEEQTDAEE